MIVKAIESRGFSSNCYLAICEETRDAAVIDPGLDASAVLRAVEQEKVNLKYIINTHGHVDHMAANAAVKNETGADILIHEDDAGMLTNVMSNLSMFMGMEIRSPAASRKLKDGDTIQIGTTVELKVIHTPGHTPGGICLLCGKTLFSGDTLFQQSIGRTDFPGGSLKTLLNSIRTRLLVLPDDTVVYSGHMPETTIGFERDHNPFL